MFSLGPDRAVRRAAIKRLDLRIPPLPQTLIEAMELMGQPAKLEVNPISAMVQGDPVVIARILQIANSAYYGLPRTIESAERAIILLGPVTVTGVVLGMNMVQLQSVLDHKAARCFMALIRHSIASAFLTRHIIEGTPRHHAHPSTRYIGRIGPSFTAGLLHDFGKIIFVYNFPSIAVDLYEKQDRGRNRKTLDVRQQEIDVLGYDHTEAGAMVANKLGFPPLLLDVIRHHHDPEKLSGNAMASRLVYATAAANLCATTMGYGFFESITWEQCFTDPCWPGILRHCGNRYSSRDELAVDIKGIQKHLDEYVDNLTAATKSPEETATAKRNPRIYYH